MQVSEEYQPYLNSTIGDTLWFHPARCLLPKMICSIEGPLPLHTRRYHLLSLHYKEYTIPKLVLLLSLIRRQYDKPLAELVFSKELFLINLQELSNLDIEQFIDTTRVF